MRLRGFAALPVARWATVVLGLALTQPVPAAEAESLEVLRQTTINLIQQLVEQGVLTKEKAAEIIRAAEQKAVAAVAEKEKTAKPELAEEKGRIRVPYVPEPVRKEIQEQIRQEVLAQAKSERWGDPGKMPEWLDRLSWEGDMRLRLQLDYLDKNNTSAAGFAIAAATAGTTRAPDLGTVSAGVANANTLDNRERLRIRARLALNAKLTESWSAGLRLTTGNITDRVSTNQSLGQDFNNYTAVFDRAFIRYQPAGWLSVTGGRIPNPYFSTDLVYDEDLNFEGVALTVKPGLYDNTLQPFFTLGAFPVREDNPPTAKSRWLYGAQAGTQWDPGKATRFKVGLAYYHYANFEGRVETPGSFILGVGPTSPDYGQFEYGRNIRQKGNTLFRTNSINDGGASIFGLASKFRPVNLTASLDLAHFDPVHVVLTADYVKNIGFDRANILSRTGFSIADGKDRGYQFRITAGMPEIRRARDWQAYTAYRYLGSDATLDGFTDSDFGLGGTNNKGYMLGFAYGVDRNVLFNVRWLSTDSIDSPTRRPGGRFSVDVLQSDVVLRF